MTLLSNFPALPRQTEIVALKEAFSRIGPTHVFLNRFPLPQPTRERQSTPFCFGMACIAAAHANRPDSPSKDLFTAGMSLWSVITEVDNREARSIDMLMAVCHLFPISTSILLRACLTIPFGPVDIAQHVWRDDCRPKALDQNCDSALFSPDGGLVLSLAGVSLNRSRLPGV